MRVVLPHGSEIGAALCGWVAAGVLWPLRRGGASAGGLGVGPAPPPARVGALGEVPHAHQPYGKNAGDRILETRYSPFRTSRSTASAITLPIMSASSLASVTA
jgi:hypothetical protein